MGEQPHATGNGLLLTPPEPDRAGPAKPAVGLLDAQPPFRRSQPTVPAPGRPKARVRRAPPGAVGGAEIGARCGMLLVGALLTVSRRRYHQVTARLVSAA